MTPKQIGCIWDNGTIVKVVARTYDLSADYKDEFGLTFEDYDRSPKDRLISRNNYKTLKGMVERLYPGVQWLEAAQYDL